MKTIKLGSGQMKFSKLMDELIVELENYDDSYCDLKHNQIRVFFDTFEKDPNKYCILVNRKDADGTFINADETLDDPYWEVKFLNNGRIETINEWHLQNFTLPVPLDFVEKMNEQR
jgi:hypothetical protein